MEQNMPALAKKIWNMVRVAYYMLRKSISKSKLMMELNVMMKRGKLAGKAIGKLMFLHHRHGHGQHGGSLPSKFLESRDLSCIGPNEYEFSCSNSPAYPSFHFPALQVGRHRRRSRHALNSGNVDDVAADNAFKAVWEMMSNEVAVEASPAFSMFGRSPMVRQLRVTDSPFPLRDTEGDSQVDKAAEEFISRFYKELRLQKSREE